MIILDTNVISEIIRAEPSLTVMDWIEKQSRAMLFTTTLTRAELLYGIAILPDGKRKLEKERIIKEILTIDFHRKILHFDNDSAQIVMQKLPLLERNQASLLANLMP